MKILIGCLLLASVAAAAGNPDQQLSFGFDYTTARSTLYLPPAQEVDLASGQSNWYTASSKLDYSQVTFDMRAPMSDSLTFNLHGGPNWLNAFGSTNGGYSIGVGLRYYTGR